MIIGIDMGHGLDGYPNSGAVGIISESAETRTLGHKVITGLQAMGYTVVNCTVDKPKSNTDSINRRIALANTQRLDLFVSIHFNSGGGQGVEVLTVNAKYMVEADRILKNIAALGFKNRGIKTALTASGAKVGVVHRTNAPALLIETCFVDTKSDTDRYKANTDKIADAIISGITGQVINKEVDDMIPTLKLSACKYNPIAAQMVEEIKGLQRCANMSPTGTATEELCMKLPVFNGGESKGSASILQTLLMLKGYLSSDPARPPLGQAVRDAVGRLRAAAGLPDTGSITDAHVWRVLLEY